jgi:hypothetical protein
VTSANEIGFTPLATFLKTSGFSQQIQMVKDAPNNIVRIDMLGDTAGVNAFDGQIIQEKGNSLDDNKGTMTIQSGGLSINALSAGLNIQATSSTLIQSGTTTTLTSGGETEINSAALDINATNHITIDTTDNFTTTSGGQTTINSNILDINTTGQTTLDTTQLELTATTGNMTWTTSSATGDFNITSGRNVNFVTNSTGAITNCTSNKDQDIFKVNNTAFDSKFLIGSATTGFRQQVNNNSYANLLALGTTQLNLSTANALMSLVSTGGAININRTGTSATAIGNATGTFALTGSTNTILGTTNINTSGTLNTAIGNTSNTTTITGSTNINTTGNDDTNIGLDTATSGSTTIRGQNINFIAYSSILLEATNAFWNNVGAGNFYYRSYNATPNIIMGDQTTATDYFGIQATATGSTIDVFSGQPLTLNASQVNIESMVGANATLTFADVRLDTPLKIETTYTTYPITTNTAVGFFTSTTTSTKFIGNTTNNLASIAIARAGCYLVEGNFLFLANPVSQSFTGISLSTVSATENQQRSMIISQASTAGGYGSHITSIFNITAATTFYLTGRSGTALGGTATQTNYLSVTRIA